MRASMSNPLSRQSMKSILRIFPFLMLPLMACNKENAPDCFQKGGEEISTQRAIPFQVQSIVCSDLIDLELFQSDAPFLEVSGPKNLLPELMTEFENGRISIRNENSCNIVRSYKPRLKVKVGVGEDFAYLELNGQGEVFSNDTLRLEKLEIVAQESVGDLRLILNCDDLKCINHAGVSNFSFLGEGRKAEFFHQGYGQMNAQDFIASEVYSNNNSIGELKVFSNAYLFAYIGAKGNLLYRGSPIQIDASITGSGDLIALD